MKIKSVKDIKDLNKKRVFVTCDFNVTLQNGKIVNDTRIKQALPTIEYLLNQGSRLVLASHLGRPKGYDLKFSLKPVAKHLQKLLRRKIFLADKFWESDEAAYLRLNKNDQIVMLENIRFHQGEKDNDPKFAKLLSAFADCFVNDAFGASHRVHASIVGISKFLPSFAGLLLEKEIKMISRAINKPKRPFLVIIGGAKTPEKISVIETILNKADTVALGGAIANTFLAAWGFGMGNSLVDYEMVEMARVVFWKATAHHSALILPKDVMIAKNSHLKPYSVDYNKVPARVAIYDIGPKTITNLQKLVMEAKTIIWNGPMGLYENKLYKKGTDDLLNAIAKAKAFKIVGGGDTLSVVGHDKYLNKFDHVSTGGSAMLEFMKLGTLPGIEVLKKN